jgi:hypothetical protein
MFQKGIVYAALHPCAQETNIPNIEDVAKSGFYTSKQTT